MQHLGLMRADHVMVPLTGEPDPRESKVGRDESLKNVLTNILQGHSDSVIVTDEDDTPVGRITLAELKSYIAGSR